MKINDLNWLDSTLKVFTPPANISMVEWLEQNVSLPELTCPEPGPYRPDRTPYVKGVYEAYENNYIEQIVLLWGRQLAKSTLTYNCICYNVSERPGPGLYLFPNEKLARYTSEVRIQPQFELCAPVMKKRTVNPDDYKKLEMKFIDSIFSLGWAGSGAQVMSRPVRFLYEDEIDEFALVVGKGQSNPLKSAEETTSNFPDRKIIKTSTPSTEDNHIWIELNTCSHVFEYWIPCPHCGRRQILQWPQIKWPKEEREPDRVCLLAYYECRFCNHRITTREKNIVLIRGEWRTHPNACKNILQDVTVNIEETETISTVLKRRTASKLGFQLPKWYSPFENATFGHAAKEFLEADQEKSETRFFKQRDFTKFWAARPHISRIKTAEFEDLLSRKIDIPALICPSDTIALVMASDPGQGGFWFIVMSIRTNHGPHIVQYGFMHRWDELTEMVNHNQYPLENDKEIRLPIWKGGIDTGGSKYTEEITMTEAAYLWLRSITRPNIFGMKGMSNQNRTGRRVQLSIIDKMPGQKGTIIPGGLGLWLIDTDSFKDAIQYYLKLPESDPKRITFHSETQKDLFVHLASEKKERDKKGKIVWTRKGQQPNHLLDCLVYCFALSDPECDGGTRLLRPPTYPIKQDTSAAANKNDYTKGWLRGIKNI